MSSSRMPRLARGGLKQAPQKPEYRGQHQDMVDNRQQGQYQLSSLTLWSGLIAGGTHSLSRLDSQPTIPLHAQLDYRAMSGSYTDDNRADAALLEITFQIEQMLSAQIGQMFFHQVWRSGACFLNQINRPTAPR